MTCDQSNERPINLNTVSEKTTREPLIFDIQRFSLHDGPGIRTTIFFKGCPLRCAWCQNPESQSLKPENSFYEETCIECLNCEAVCKEMAVSLSSFGTNTRGGKYTCGLYSVTAHEYFGRVTGAMPNGRRRGEAFAAGIAPTNGADRKGPTAMLNSANRIDMTEMANGVNLNIKFTPHILRGPTGVSALKNLIKTYFRRGGMQTQINVLDAAVLKKARRNPKAYPNLLVRVSGYSSYFNDLTPALQDEIIERSEMEVG